MTVESDQRLAYLELEEEGGVAISHYHLVKSQDTDFLHTKYKLVGVNIIA